MELRSTESSFDSTLNVLKDFLNDLLKSEEIPDEAKDKISVLYNFINSITVTFNSCKYLFCIIGYTIEKRNTKLSYQAINSEQTIFFLNRIKKHVTEYYNNILAPIVIPVTLKTSDENYEDSEKDSKEEIQVFAKNEPETSVISKTITYTIDEEIKNTLNQNINKFFKAIQPLIAYIKIEIE